VTGGGAVNDGSAIVFIVVAPAPEVSARTGAAANWPVTARCQIAA
jgi:hypothetical protein